jgi:hypothetical protein
MQLLVRECQIKHFLADKGIFIENLIEFTKLKEDYLIEVLRFKLPVLSLHVREIPGICERNVKSRWVIIWVASWTLI